MSFERSFERMIQHEGGFAYTNITDDKGGKTFAGITRRWFPEWEGWKHIDSGDNPPVDLVQQFYKENFWDVIRGDEMLPCRAFAIFDFAVNAGVRLAVMMAQSAAGVKTDGIVGPETVNAIENTSCFLEKYALRKLKYYASLCDNDKTQKKFLLGWINRTLEEL